MYCIRSSSKSIHETESGVHFCNRCTLLSSLSPSLPSPSPFSVPESKAPDLSMWSSTESSNIYERNTMRLKSDHNGTANNKLNQKNMSIKEFNEEHFWTGVWGG